MIDEATDIKIQLSELDGKINNILEKLDDIKDIQKSDGSCIARINERLPVHEIRISNIEQESYGKRIGNIEQEIEKMHGSFVIFKYIWYIITVILSIILTYIEFHKYK